MASTRPADLLKLRDDLQARMQTCESDQNFAVMGRLLVDVLKQIEEAGTASNDGKPREGSVLSEFEAKLRERKSGPADQGRAAQ